MDIDKTKYSTAIEHLDTVVADIDDHIKNGKDFTAFILIALGIEFIGNFFDNKEFDEGGQSEIRYGYALDLFPDWYKNNKTWIYKQFRGPLIHQYRAGGQIYLTSNIKNQAPLTEHLTTKDEKRVFVVEQLFIHFNDAVNKLKNKVNRPGYQFKTKPEKLFGEINVLYSTDKDGNPLPSGPCYNASGSTTTVKTIRPKKK